MKTTLDIKTSSDAGGFEGYGSVFYRLDRHGDIIVPGAFKASLPRFLSEGFVGGVGHKHDNPVGKFTDAYEDERGLFVKAQFSDVPEAKTVRTLLQDKVVQKLSVGIDVKESDYVSPAVVKTLWSKAGYTPDADDMFRLERVKKVRLITRADLREVSPVTIPSNDDARIMAVKSFDDTPTEFQKFIHLGRVAIYKLALIETKEGRVLSGKNEMKLRAMVEVLTSVTEELNNLLMMVATAPAVDEAEEETENETPEKNATGGSKADEEAAEEDEEGPDERKIEQDEEFAKQRGADKKKSNKETKAAILKLLLKAAC